MRLADEPAHLSLTPEVAKLLIAAVARLAHAELGLHALALSQHRPTGGSNAPDRLAAHGNNLGAALGTAMSRIAYALRTLRAPQPIPTLRLIYMGLSSEPELRGTALVAIVDRLVDAANTHVGRHRTRPLASVAVSAPGRSEQQRQ